MNRRRFFYNVHLMMGAICSLPALITVLTGILLILRSHLTFMQPSSISLGPVSIEKMVAPKVFLEGKYDEKKIKSVIYKPAKGIIQVRTSDYREDIYSSKTGKLISSGAKRTSFFIQLHEGSYFGKGVRDYLFFPSAVALFITLITGIYLLYSWMKRFLLRRNNNISKGLIHE